MGCGGSTPAVSVETPVAEHRQAMQQQQQQPQQRQQQDTNNGRGELSMAECSFWMHLLTPFRASCACCEGHDPPFYRSHVEVPNTFEPYVQDACPFDSGATSRRRRCSSDTRDYQLATRLVHSQILARHIRYRRTGASSHLGPRALSLELAGMFGTARRLAQGFCWPFLRTTARSIGVPLWNGLYLRVLNASLRP